MTEWLSLGEAADLLGIHPSTLRRWSEAGRLPCVRTEGGHRRFDRAVIEEHVTSSGNTNLQTRGHLTVGVASSGSVMAAQTPPWRDTFHGKELEEVRQLGQRLLGLLLQYLTRQNEDARFLTESREIGRTYGRETAEAGLAMLDMVEAFLYFRSHFSEMTIQLPALPRAGDDAEIRRLHKRIDRFMNEVLLGAIEGHEGGCLAE